MGSSLLGLGVLAGPTIVIAALLEGAHSAVGLPHHLNLHSQRWASVCAHYAIYMISKT